MEKIGKWAFIGIFAVLLFPLALGLMLLIGGMAHKSPKPRPALDPVSGKPVKFTLVEKLKQISIPSEILILLGILGIVGQWYWTKAVFTFLA